MNCNRCKLLLLFTGFRVFFRLLFQLLLPLLLLARSVVDVQADDSFPQPIPANPLQTDSADEVTAQWAEQYLQRTQSILLDGSDSDHVMSLYYFGWASGQAAERYTLIGLERVRGAEYRQFFTLLVFRDQTLLGYYRNVPSFPSAVNEDGRVRFPRGVDAVLQATLSAWNITQIHIEQEALCQTVGRASESAEPQRICVSWTPASS